MATDKELAYDALMNERRAFLAEKGEEYRETVEGMEKTALVLLARIMARLQTVNAESTPYRALWIVAQCREILAPMSKKLDLIDKYEKEKKKVAAYDQEKARGE
jgi:hypothetical protein